MLKVRMAVLDSDKVYLERMGRYLLDYYADRIETHMFSERKEALEAVNEERYDILLISSDFASEDDLHENRFHTVILADTADISEYNGVCAVCRYQKAGSLISKILKLYADMLSESATVRRNQKQKGRIVLFLSGTEGAGASVVSASYCEYMALKNRKTLYLNLKQTGISSDIFDDPTPDGSLTDVIFALKSKKTGLSLKLESLLRRNSDGICFYRKCSNCLDYSELDPDELDILLNEAGMLFDDISVTCDFDLSEKFIHLLERADEIIMVTADDERSSEILKRKKEILQEIGKRRIRNFPDTYLIVNKASAEHLYDSDMSVLGRIPEYEHMSNIQKARAVSASGIFDSLCADI